MQKSGNNSTQFQINELNIGLTESELRDIFSKESELLLKEAQIIAEDIARKRLADYTNILLPKLVKSEMLNSFSEPSVQLLFKNTEKTAISTTRNYDYEMLSELLIHRIRRKEDYCIKSSVNKAIEIIDQISEDALLGITLSFAILMLHPQSGNVQDGLKIMDDLFNKIIENNTLPIGLSWIENLEIVGALRIVPFSRKDNMDSLYFKGFNGYACVGIKNDSELYRDTIEKFSKYDIPMNLLTPNYLINGYSRLEILNIEALETIEFLKTMPDGNTNIFRLTNQQKQILKEVFNSYDKSDILINEVKLKFNDLLYSYKSLGSVIKWWNEIVDKTNYDINAVGKVLAHANAKRIDSSLPDLN